MAKSIRSKIKKRYRTAKRQRVEKVVEAKRLHDKNSGLMKLMAGERTHVAAPQNAFLHPGAAGAEIPQKSVKTAVDFRSEHMPLSGYAYAGGRRKFTEAEKAIHTELNNQHPQIRIIAGKGAEIEIATMEPEDLKKDDTEMEATDLKEVDNSRIPIAVKTGGKQKKQHRARPNVHGKKKQGAAAAKGKNLKK